mgnify:CR=1 FL=1
MRKGSPVCPEKNKSFPDVIKLSKFDFDYYEVAYPNATQEVYTYKRGGASGSVAGTVTINYVDATKANVLNAAVVVADP